MKIISFEEGQHGKEWLDWRRGGIGASDLGVIMGSNPYKTQLTLWDEKCGFKSEDVITPPMAHGIKNESKAREWINKHQNLDLQPLCVEDIVSPHFKASLDGYDKDGKVLCEIKCPVSHDVLDKAREQRAVPMYWQHQVQWQIMLTKPIRSFIAFWDYRYESCFTIEMFAQPTLQKEMREKAEEFWRLIRMGVPPKPSEKDYVRVEDDELKELLEEYKDHNAVAKAADQRKKELRAEIVEFGDDGNFMSNGFFITRCSPRTIYNIEQMRLDGIDVDSYIKKNNGIGFYRISCPK